MTEAVAKAINEIRTGFPGHAVIVTEDGQGGAFVIVENLPVADLYIQNTTWFGFRITFQYPNADVYPHFVRHDLTRKNSVSMSPAIRSGYSFQGRPALQVSRRSNRLNPATDTALHKLRKVLLWLTTNS